MKAYILIRIQAGNSSEVIQNVRALRGVEKASLTFGPFDALAEVAGANLSEIGKLVHFELLAIPGILETTTCLAVDEAV